MKILILMMDDAVSSHVWLAMVQQHIKDGRSVLVINDANNPHMTIGIGDGLPQIPAELAEHPNFKSCVLSADTVKEVATTLSTLPADVAVMFNCEAFEMAQREPELLEIARIAGKLPNDVVFTAYPFWFVQQGDHGQVPAFSDIDWDHVAGCHTLHFDEAFRRLMPGLAPLFNLEEQPTPWYQADPFAARWFVLNRTGAYAVPLPYHQFSSAPHAFPEAWDVRHAHERIPKPTPAQSTEPHRRLSFFQRLPWFRKS